ncbi:MAG: hypothetical protein AUI93_04085 [Crenarchaeota archaeon 13_1_40CM_3_52_10]|nr:MAG: hypothetical protein AUI93_04085 [Crenarchaeota archaeon 13_1_40CM_3_52_10]
MILNDSLGSKETIRFATDFTFAGVRGDHSCVAGALTHTPLFLDRLLSGGDSRRVLPIKARSGLGSVEHYLAFQGEISHVSNAPVQILYQGWEWAIFK